MEQMETLISIIVERLPREQVHDILQGITNKITDGYCPLCFMEDYPVDKQGNEIKGDDVSMADEWRERHDDECPVTLIENKLRLILSEGVH